LNRTAGLPFEAQAAIEERGQPLGFLPGRAPHRYRQIYEGLDGDVDAVLY